MKRPSFQFYPGDWLNDAALRLCSVPARGLWIDMLCLMHQGSEYGYLKVNHKVILPSNLAHILGATLPEVEGWLGELESAGVFSKDAEDCIFSRRMIRDEEIRKSRASGGYLGGNPVLTGKQKVNLKPNLPPTPSSSSSSSSSSSDKVRTQKFIRPSVDEVKLCCAKTGLPESDAIWFWNKCEGNGWTNGGHPIKSWQHTIASWKAGGWMASQRVSKNENNIRPHVLTDATWDATTDTQ